MTAPATVIFQKTWCPFCAGKAKLTIEKMRSLARAQGGKCLSTKYINTKTKLKWQCKEGHAWMAVPNNIQQGQWCMQCSGNLKLSIPKMQMIAKSRNGKCLSEKYINSSTKLKWQCGEGHVWAAAASDIISEDSWCSFLCGKYKTYH